jgi:Transposase zinc-ribbon domain/ISXO2-like transposase domain
VADPVEPSQPAGPVAGRDYPRTRDEFEAAFPHEDACARYLERLSWPDGFVCPACGAVGEPWRGSRRRLVCRRCQHQTSVTAGTLFQGTRTPLTHWFEAAWLIATADHGVSARHLQHHLGLASYETAWAMLHRYRRAMVRSGRPRLSGSVEIVTTVVGARGGGGAGAGRQAATVAAAVEVREAGELGRVRMQRTPGSAAADLAAFAGWAVEPGTLVRSGRQDAAPLLADRGYLTPTEPDEPPALAAGADVVARLHRWLAATHSGAVSAEQLDWYLDEFTFRFNRRRATHRGLLFYRLLEESVVTPPQTYRSVTAPPPSTAR